MNHKKSKWIPEITYEQDDEGSQLGNLPLVHVPSGEVMPPVLFIWEARDTGKIEPGYDGDDVPVVDWELKQYCAMETLKSKLSHEDYDKVRAALGLKPLDVATREGQVITQKVRENLGDVELKSLGKKL